MSKRAPALLIEDMQNAINKIFSYTKDVPFDIFSNDDKTINAVLYCLQILGEATKRLPNDFVKKHTKIEWQDIIDMRNIIAHGYDQINLETVWQIIQYDLPPLKQKLENIKLI